MLDKKLNSVVVEFFLENIFHELALHFLEGFISFLSQVVFTKCHFNLFLRIPKFSWICHKILECSHNILGNIFFLVMLQFIHTFLLFSSEIARVFKWTITESAFLRKKILRNYLLVWDKFVFLGFQINMVIISFILSFFFLFKLWWNNILSDSILIQNYLSIVTEARLEVGI